MSDLPELFTLRDLASCCPAIYGESSDLGIQSRLARATITSDHYFEHGLHDIERLTLALVVAAAAVPR